MDGPKRSVAPPRGRPQNQSRPPTLPPPGGGIRPKHQSWWQLAWGRRGPAGITLRVQRYRAGNQCVGSPVTKGKVNNPSSVLGWKVSDPTVSLPENEKGKRESDFGRLQCHFPGKWGVCSFSDSHFWTRKSLKNGRRPR